jgi:hypothetical protein
MLKEQTGEHLGGDGFATQTRGSLSSIEGRKPGTVVWVSRPAEAVLCSLVKQAKGGR